MDLQKFPAAWSVDGRALLWSEVAPPGQRSYQVMDTASGRMTNIAFTGPVHQSALVMLNDYELATVDYASFRGSVTRFSVDVADVRNGTVLRSVPVDLSAQLRPGEHLGMYSFIPLFSANGSPARLWTNVAISVESAGPGSMPVGAIGVDLTSGRVLTRLDWARPGLGDVTSLVGVVADGAVVARLTKDATELSIVSDTGERRVVTRLTSFFDVRPAGGVGF